ncbi:MAG: anhydro-N-acetylmuramic acid kinase [Bacteroidia bacterium]|nr:anhydro-N-acetylmuramic acid kinase [Bacteroidia bacterium]
MRFRAIGLMSGTSLDGLDIACCEFTLSGDQWKWKILHALTVPYPAQLLDRIVNAHRLPAHALAALHDELGIFFGMECEKIIHSTGFQPDLISSHGHTVFHRPELGITLQIGNPALIAKQTGVLTAADFRRGDVAAGGQGAPLVPIGDRYLFPGYRFCLNLGGIANISYEKNGKRMAFDCCPFNQVLNALAALEGFPFDEDGKLSASGTVNPELLDELNALPFYRNAPPRSLGREWVEESFMPVLNKHSLPVRDLMATACAHFAEVNAAIINAENPEEHDRILVSGGGARHVLFVGLLQQRTKATVETASGDILSFKEALIFGLLGVLKMTGRNNILASVTGAAADHCGGELFRA